MSEYGLLMPVNRVEPIICTTTPEQNREEAKAWIAAWRDRSSKRKHDSTTLVLF